MSAYYNEIDPFAAAWLRNLVAAGLICGGDVDERSIVDVVPDDLKEYKQCHFFAGIGVWSHALRQAGWPDERDVWTGSCPCQPFSAAGKGGGFADERHLWPAFFHLIRERRPERVFGEQVASKNGLVWLDLVQADLGVKVTSAGQSICQLRASARRTSDKGFTSALPTPTARDYRHGMSQENLNRRKSHSRGVNLNEFMQRVLGKSGTLNPTFLCLLMGLPIVWDEQSPTVTPSTRSKRQVS